MKNKYHCGICVNQSPEAIKSQVNMFIVPELVELLSGIKPGERFEFVLTRIINSDDPFGDHASFAWRPEKPLSLGVTDSTKVS